MIKYEPHYNIHPKEIIFDMIINGANINPGDEVYEDYYRFITKNGVLTDNLAEFLSVSTQTSKEFWYNAYNSWKEKI